MIVVKGEWLGVSGSSWIRGEGVLVAKGKVSSINCTCRDV